MFIAGLRAATVAMTALAGLSLLAGCGGGGGAAVSEARLQELEARFTPGLHSLMLDLGMRHASVWFAGEAGNWPLADYLVHELEELLEDIEELHPVYREIRVAELLGEMTLPAVESLQEAVEAGDRAGFARAYDRLTSACNACHEVADRAAIVIQRPTAPPFTNLRYPP
jgi:hypothetical protein